MSLRSRLSLKRWQQTFARLIVLRSADGSNKEIVLRRPIMPIVRVPVFDAPTPFVSMDLVYVRPKLTYRDYHLMPYTNVSGLPVYQEARG